MAYEELCMYCFENLGGESVCPHCGRDNRAAVPQIQMLPGSLVYHDRFLIGRALGQDATGIVYAAYDTKRENKLRLREYLPRDCAERLNDGSVAPMAGLEDQFEKGLKRLRASVEGVEDPKKRHFFFEENGTAYIAQRKSAAAETPHHRGDDEEERGGLRIGWVIGIAAAVVVVAAIVVISLISGALSGADDVVQMPTLSPDEVWAPAETPTPTPYVSPTFAALVDPEQSWMDYTYSGNVEEEFQQQVSASKTATPKPTVRADTPNYSTVSGKSDAATITKLQERLKTLGWLSSVNGTYDDATRQAVKDFQNYINENVRPSEKLDVDGIAGPKTMMWLYGTDQTKPTPAPTPLVTANPGDESVVDKNSSKTDVVAVQRKLIVLGLMKSGSDDGVYGNTTTKAVKQFQQRVNEIEGFEVLEVSGVVDSQTMAYLNHYVEWWQAMQQATATPAPSKTPTPTDAPTAEPTDIPDKEETGQTVDASSSKASIQAVQRMLIQVGLLSEGADDGVYGSGTVSAVAKFQEWYNQQAGKNVLAVTGTADAMTLSYLEYVTSEGMLVRSPAPTEAPTPTPEPDNTPIPDKPEDDLVIDASSEKSSIQAVQKMLIQVGLLSEGGADGVYGKGTAAAVTAFQKFVNQEQGAGTVPETGVCDMLTLSFLEEYAEAGVSAAPTQSPAKVQNMTLTVNGAKPGSDPVAVSGDSIAFAWSAQGDVESYYLYITDADGSSPYQYEAIEYTEGKISTADLKPGTVYTIDVGALPVGGEESDIAWVSARFYIPDASATATPEPEAKPGASLRINGQAAQSGVMEVVGETIEFDWAAEGDVKNYSVDVSGDDGSVIYGAEAYKGTSGHIPGSEFKPGVTYTFTVGVNYADGSATVWSSTQFRLAGETPTEAPDSTEDPVPTEAPATVKPVQAPVLSVNGASAGGVAEVSGDSVRIEWSGEEGVESYAVKITGDDGSTILSETSYAGTQGTIPMSQLKPGVVYTAAIGARPAGGSDEDVVWSSAQFTVPLAPTDTPKPTVATVTKPTIDIDVANATNKDGIPYFGSETATFRWQSDGEVARYYAYLVNAADERKDLGVSSETSYTAQLNALPAGEYRFVVGALPAGGTEEDVQWTSFTFGIPAPETTPTPAPEATEAPAAQWPTQLDGSSSAESVQQVQMKLYSLGILTTADIQQGVLDQVTRESIAAFQQRMNENYDLGLPGFDPYDIDAAVDSATLQALYRAAIDENGDIVLPE